MKKIVLLLIIVNLVFPQTFSWDDGGVPVRQGAHIEWSRTGDVGDNGNMILGWSDTRSGNRDVYAQKVDSNGNELWGEEGLLVVGYEGRQEDPVMISDDNGGVYVIWSDFRNIPFSDGQPYAQHISSDGTLTWDSDGVPLSDDKLTEYTLNMCKDGNGGVFAIWKKKSSSHYGSYLNINNGPTDEVEVISSAWSHSNPSLETAGNGGAVMVWADERNANKDIYGQRLVFDGTNVVLEWESIEDENGDGVDDYAIGGIPISTAPGEQTSQKVTYYSEDYSVVVWQDSRNQNGAQFPVIYATFLDLDGNPSDFYGADGLPVVSTHDADGAWNNETAAHKKPRVKANSDGAYVIWNDFRDDYDGDIYIQKITHENNGVWDSSSSNVADGFFVSDEVGYQTNSRLTLDGNGGVYVVWENHDNSQTDIKIKHLDADGNSTFDSDGLSICSSNKDQISPLVRKDGNGGAFSVWQDHREGSISLYVQHLNVYGVVSMIDDGIKLFYGIDYNGQLYNDVDPLQLTPKSLYLGDDQTLLFWEDKRYGNIDLITEWGAYPLTTSYVYAELIDGNFGNTGTNNGSILSEFPYQIKPSMKSYDSGYLYHFIGQDFVSGEDILSLEYLDHNFISTQDNPVSVDGTDWANQKNFITEFDVDGNLYVVYAKEDPPLPSSIWVQIYESDGDEILSEPINLQFNEDNYNYYPRELFHNPNGGMVLVFDQNGLDIRAIGINADGSSWDEAVSIIENSGGQQFQDAVATNDGIFITWKDSRNGNNDIFGQHISYNGTILNSSDNGISLCEADNDQLGSSVAYVSTSNIVTTCWEDFRNGLDWNAYCREVNLNSHIVSDEFILSDAPGDQKNPFLYTSLTNTVLVVWEDFRNDTYEYADIYMQELVNGQNSYADNGVAVCDGFHNQVNPKIDLLSDQSEISYLIYWDDMRSSGKEDLINIFAQKLVKQDCMGSNDGTAWINNCGDCITDVDVTCVQGCDGNWASGNTALLDLGCGCGEFAPIVYYIDNDGDGLGSGNSFTSCESQGDNWVTNGDDDDDQCSGIVDECGVCDGDNTSKDCSGTCFGPAEEDECGVCDSDSTNDNTSCTQDCNNQWDGSAEEDECGVCDGNGCYQQDCETYPSDQYDCEGVILSLEASIPSEFGLMQNYPNPFNPSTSINFSIPEFSMVSISIYNINGQKIKSLIQRNMSPGYHQISWYGDDDNGISVSNGIYFYIMESSQFVEKRKMLFIK